MFLGKTLETNKTSFKMILTVFVVRVESKTWWSCCQHHLRCKMEAPGVRPWLRCVSCFTTRPVTRKPFITIQPAKAEGKITSQAPYSRWLDYILVSIISHQDNEHFPLKSLQGSLFDVKAVNVTVSNSESSSCTCPICPAIAQAVAALE